VKLTANSLDRLRLILREDFGLEVNDQELHTIAFNLLGYFNALLEYDREEDKLPETAPATETTI
jgi:hypothetical protein